MKLSQLGSTGKLKKTSFNGPAYGGIKSARFVLTEFGKSVIESELLDEPASNLRKN